VSTEVSESDIKSETGAHNVRRMLKWDSGKQIPTESVVLHYPDALPDFVSIGFLRFTAKGSVCPLQQRSQFGWLPNKG